MPELRLMQETIIICNRKGRKGVGKSWLGQGLALSLGLLSLLGPGSVLATENAPRKAFAGWADVPEEKQLEVTLWYAESEAYHIWTGHQRVNANDNHIGEDYGVDKMNGLILLDYGIYPKWAIDLNVGMTTTGARSFNSSFASESTTGLSDTSLGVRYQIFNEAEAESAWIPTLTFRAGAVLPGSYDKNSPFAPGNHSAAIEPSLLAKKHFGWKGFGAYGDFLYRWMRSSGDDQYIIAVGFFQEIKGWTLDAGFRHQQQLSGDDLVWNGVGTPIKYSPQVREISDSIEAGFSYTTQKRHWTYGFYTRKTFDGSNTDSAFWVGGYFRVPFSFAKAKAEK
jgi:hypothetical protein